MKKFTILTFVIIFFTTSYAQSNFNPKHPKYHIYELNFLVVKKGDAAKVFRTLLKDNRNFAPYIKKAKEIKNGSRSELRMFGKVIHKVDYRNNTLTNFTTKGHMLHPGSVTFRFYRKKKAVYVHIKGEGTGDYRWLNKKLASKLWAAVVRTQRRYLQKHK